MVYSTLDKLKARTAELRHRRYVGLVPITPLVALEGGLDSDDVYADPPSGEVNADKTMALSLYDVITGYDRYIWMKKKIAVPQRKDGCRPIGIFNFNDGGGFEGVLYVDGKPYQGIDSNHTEVLLDEFAGKEIELTILLWSGLNGSGDKTPRRQKVNSAHVGYLSVDTDEYYYLARTICESADVMPHGSAERYATLRALDESMLLVDWSDNEDEFYASVKAALASLKVSLSRMEKHSAVTVAGVGHTHIDVAWLWRLKHTREKAIRSFATALRLMEEFPEFIFLQSQPQLYKYIKNDCPYIYEKIKKRVSEGRWEADGAMWLEADCNISSGEALARQFLYGIRFFEEEFGVRCRHLWLPDAFGYSWALPQLMKQCGIKTFMTTKISWNEVNRMPHNIFRWRGIDGTEVLTYFITTPTRGSYETATYNGYMDPYSAVGAWECFRDKEITNRVLISYGYGDGGGGVNRDMLMLRRAMDMMPGLPNVKTEKAGEFFEYIHRDAKAAGDRVAVWDGELYLEFHRGTYTTQAKNKKNNRKAEFQLFRAEAISSLASIIKPDFKYPKDKIDLCWETTLRNQFHDILPGSSIREVYEDSEKEYKEVFDTLDAVEGEVTEVLTNQKAGTYTIFEPSPYCAERIIRLPYNSGDTYFSADGSPLPVQVTDDGMYADVLVKTEPLSLSCVTKAPADTQNNVIEQGVISTFSFDSDSKTLVTPHYIIKWDENNALVSIYDRDNEREVLAPGERGNILEIYEDKPLQYDAWNIDVFYSEKKKEAIATKKPRIVSSGELYAVVRFESTSDSGKSTITQDMKVYKDSRTIDFKTRVDWHEEHRLLKAAFCVDIRATDATYDIQYGHVRRPTHKNTSWDVARYEVVGHKWADVSEDGYGVALLNDCKYGYGICGNKMTLSLLRSSKHPDPVADMGVHEFTYSLLPHTGSVTSESAGVIEEAMALNTSPFVKEGEPLLCNGAKNTAHLVKISSDRVCVDAVKLAEDGDGYIIRLHEAGGGHRRVSLTSDFNIKQYVECNILEEPLGDVTAGEKIELALRPFEIKTLRVWF